MIDETGESAYDVGILLPLVMITPADSFLQSTGNIISLSAAQAQDGMLTTDADSDFADMYHFRV